MTPFNLIGRPATLVALALLSVASAFARTPPSPMLAVADAAVAHATTTLTSEGAPGELQIAKAKLAAAHEAFNRKDFVRANQLAEQADLDAQVAELHAQSARSSKAATETQEAARVLSEELSRKTAH